MQYLIIFLYIVFFSAVVFMGAYNWLYLSRVNKTGRQLGITLPPIVQKLLTINLLVSLGVAFFIGTFLLKTILASRL